MKKVFIIILFFPVILFSQELPTVLQQQLESISDKNEEEINEDDQYILILEQLTKNPIRINHASEDEFQVLRILTDLQIQNFLSYRKLAGHIIHIYELQAIPSWNIDVIRKILPYITISNDPQIKEEILSRLKKGEHNILTCFSRTLEKQQGYDTSHSGYFTGDPNRLFFRYRYQYKNLLYYGIVCDKDAGERTWGYGIHGFDFYSFHFFTKDHGILKSLAIGDYTVSLGQGLVQWQTMGFSKGMETMAIKRQGPVIMPYRSSGEFYFNRGIAISLHKKRWEANLFFSRKKISGNADESGTNFSGIQASGLHRTLTELENRKKILSVSYGGNLSYRSDAFRISLNSVSYSFGIPLIKRDQPYNSFSFSGKQLITTSADFSYTFRNLHCFGELAMNDKFHHGFVMGIILSAHHNIDLSFLYRNIQKEYQSLMGNAFTESSLPGNEKGMYAGISIRPAPGVQINGYADIFNFPWLRFRMDAPVRGYDYLAQLQWNPDKQSEIYFRFTSSNKPLNNPNFHAENYPEPHLKKQVRLNFSKIITKAFSLKSRLDLLWLKIKGVENGEGFSVFTEASFQLNNWLRFNCRLHYFETDGYNSRLYAYESGVAYSFSIPALYDNGFRYYLNCRAEILKKTTIWFRWAQTRYLNKEEIGTGPALIKGNTRSDFSIQVAFQL